AARATADSHAEPLAGCEERAGSLGLEPQQLAERLARAIELHDAEPAPVLGGQVDPPELEVARNVLEEIHELEPRADVVARGDEPGIAVAPEQAENEPPDGVGGVDAVVLEVGPRLVLGNALVDPVCLDQAEE